MNRNDDDVSLLISDCKKRAAHLSEWEFEFINSLGCTFPARPLTDKQLHRLEIIWDRVTGET